MNDFGKRCFGSDLYVTQSDYDLQSVIFYEEIRFVIPNHV